MAAAEERMLEERDSSESDARVRLVSFSPQHLRIAGILGEPELADDPLFATNASRVGNRAKVVEEIAARGYEEQPHPWKDGIVAKGGDVSPLSGPLNR